MVASAQSANNTIRLIRNSSANRCFSRIVVQPLAQPRRSTCLSTRNSTTAHAAIASAPSAARGARAGSITNGSNTIDAASAMAICAVTDSTGGPVRPSESITGSANAADDDAISTA